MNIKNYVKDALGEDVKYEYKAILTAENPIKWGKTLVAFANGNGGFLFVGVGNDGEAFGLTLGQIDQMKNLILKVNDRAIFPHVKYRISLIGIDENEEKYLVSIYVKPSDGIVRYRDGDFNEKVFVKADASAPPASPEEIIALSKRKLRLDESLSDAAFSSARWSSYLELCETYRKDQSQPTLKELESMSLVSEDGKAKEGFLMFANDYDGTDTQIHCRLWEGENKTSAVLDRSEFSGSLAKTFLSALAFIERNVRKGYRKTEDGGRKEIRAYPRLAVREALVNAIAHRDYSIQGSQVDVDIFEDRLEITSPGSWLLPKPFSSYPLETIPSIRRNEIIALAFDCANLMERSGSGFQTIFDSYKDDPEEKRPVVLTYDGFFTIRLFDMLFLKEAASEEIPSLELDWQSIILKELQKSPRTTGQLQKLTPYKSRRGFILYVISPLVRSGKIKRVGNPRSNKSVFILG